MTGMTLKQAAIAELWAATSDYCAALATPAKKGFAEASIRLHIARGGDIPRSYVRVSKSIVRALTPNP